MTRFASVVLYSLALAGGTYVAFQPTFDSGFAHMQADPGDTLLNHYILEHTWKVLSDPAYIGTLWSPPMFAPQQGTLAYSENLLGVAPLYWLLRLGLPADLAYQWWMILLQGLNFLAGAWVLRRLGVPVLLVVAGAYLWAYGVVHIDQLRHQQLIPRYGIPVAIYALWRFLQAPGLKMVHLGLGATFLQAAACLYTGWFLILTLGLFAGAALALHPASGRQCLAWARTRPGGLALAALLWGVAFALLAAPYQLAFHDIQRNRYEILQHMPTFASWWASPPGARWYETIRPYRYGVDSENTLFSGFMLYGLAVVGLVAAKACWRHPRFATPARLTATCLLTALALMVITTDWSGQGHSGWLFLRHLPGGNAIRVVSRVNLCVQMLLILGGVLGLTLALVRWKLPRGPRHALMAGVTAALIFEQTGFPAPAFEKSLFYPQVERYSHELKAGDLGYIIRTWGNIPEHTDILAMWAGMQANIPVINGYSGRAPVGFPDSIIVSEEELRAWLDTHWQGRVIVIAPMDPPEIRELLIP